MNYFCSNRFAKFGMFNSIRFILQLFDGTFSLVAFRENVCFVMGILRRQSLVISSKTSIIIHKTFTSMFE